MEEKKVILRALIASMMMSLSVSAAPTPRGSPAGEYHELQVKEVRIGVHHTAKEAADLKTRPKQPEPEGNLTDESKAEAATAMLHKLEAQLQEQTSRQRSADKDHLLMEKWLAENINDLHRELKQAESDFEHYVQVTKRLVAQSESQVRQQVLVLHSPLAALLAQWPLALAGQRS